jgi:hypothetical protein
MRRTLGRIALSLLVVMVADWCPTTPPYPLDTLGQARAQSFAVPGSPTILWSSASASDVNSSSEVSLLQFTLPAAYIATSTTVPVGSSVPTYVSNNTGLSALLNLTPQPLHFRAIGTVGGGAGTTLNLGINLQGSNASLTMNNINFTSTTSVQPARLDVYLVPLATTSATPTSGNNSMWMYARFEYGNVNAATITTTSGLAALNTASASVLNVVGRWAAASNTSALIFYNRILRIGE